MRLVAKSRVSWRGGHCPKACCVTDFGIRSYDLAYAIMDGYDATILVDASPQGASRAPFI